MNSNKLTELLGALFASPLPAGAKRHIVFWYDEEQTCLDTVHDLVPDGVRVQVLQGNNNFSTKKLLEHDDRVHHYLVYGPFKKPDERCDWLLDTFLYAREFTPDHTSLVMSECGMADSALRPLVNIYALFFKNKDRCARLKSLTSSFSGETLELSMIAVLAREKSPSIEEIVRKLFIEGIEENRTLEELKKYGLEERFWHYAGAHYGYTPDHPTLKGLLSSIILTALKDSMKDNFPGQWKNYLLTKWNASVLFVNHWMNDLSARQSYETHVRQLQQEFDLPAAVKEWDDTLPEMADCDIFEIFDRALIAYINEKLLSLSGDYGQLKKLCEARRTSHWYDSCRHLYEALESAMELFELVERLEKAGLHCSSPSECLRAYTGELYRGDQAYRHFYAAYDVDRPDLLKPLQEKVENYYGNSYLKMLSACWSAKVEEAMTERWEVAGTESQHEFYRNEVKRILDRDERNKVYVIISDALRFETARELTDYLRCDEKLRGEVELSPMLGVVPSYTALGMASLLPHERMAIAQDASVTVDGTDTATLDNREAVLRHGINESKAMKYSELKELSRADLRECLKPYRVVYVYHNIIDATGEKQETEKQVFDAVNTAFTDISDCIRRLVSAVSATSIFITADHGFLYNRNPLGESDRLIRGAHKTIKELKRCILVESKEESAASGTLAISMDYLLGAGTLMKAVVPKGMHRFRIPGPGINYVHGGASLQEIVIPLISFKGKRDATQKKVDITLTNTSRKITNNKYTLNFFQTEKMGGPYLPRTLKVSLWDMDRNEQVSDEKQIIADRESDDAREREIKVIITLKSIPYDRHKTYYLKLEEESSHYAMIEFTISIAFTNDFGL